MEKKIKGIIFLYDDNQTVIKKLPINHLKFKKDIINKMSEERFSDPDPCIIHQTYCTNMIAENLRNKIDTEYPDIINQLIDTSNTPNDIIDTLDTNQLINVKYIKIT